MLPISTKLTLLILALPIAVLVLSDVAIFYYYKTIDVSASIATIAVLLLVWERLRDSLSRKLEYLHKDFLSKLYKTFQTDVLYFSKVEVKGIRFDLERYGKFMTMLLYPRNLLKKIDDFVVCDDELSERVSQINDIGKKLLGLRSAQSLDGGLWHHLLGIRSLRSRDIQDYMARPMFKSYAEQARIAEKEESELIEETKNLYEEGERMRKEIFGKLEEFLKSNNLRLESEPVSYVHY